MYWLEFILSSAVIIFAGVRLTVYADKLSDKLHLGKMWIGIVLLGFVTSLPEAITSLIAVVSLKAGDLAVGNLLGSNNFNPMFIVVMDIMYREGSITDAIRPKKSHNISALFAMGLVLIVVGEILSGSKLLGYSIGPLSVGSILIIFVYFVGMRYLAFLGGAEKESYNISSFCEMSLTRIYTNLFLSSAVVVFGAILLTNSADTIAHNTGLGRTFVGSIFLAFVTSLPEMVVTLSALKLRAFDLAVGNIFGSNMTNMFIMSICSVFYKGTSLLSAVSKTHILMGTLSILLVSIMLFGLQRRSKKTYFGLGLDSIIMLLFFFAGTGILYTMR